MRQFFQKKTTYYFFTLAALLAFAIMYTNYMIQLNLEPSGNDIYGHLYRAKYMYENILKGNFFPLYEQHWYNGNQMFRYWAPFPFYVMSLLIGCCHSDITLAYYCLAGFSIFFGGIPFLIMGRRCERSFCGLSLALLWFIMPENTRVFYCEGTLPRMITSILIPYLVLFIYLYLRENKKTALLGIFISTALITLSHTMIMALVGITVFLYLLFDLRKGRGITKPIIILMDMIGGIMLTGIWLIPALTGGLVDMDANATSSVTQIMVHDIFVALNPMNRIHGVTDTFYFGIAVIALSLLGILLAENKKKSGFVLSIVVLLLTLPEFYPLIISLPLGQLLWFMRIVPLAYAFFFLTLLEWNKLKKPFVLIAILILVMDAIPSFNLERYETKTSEEAKEASQLIKDHTTTRAAIMDLSELASYPSYELCTGENAIDYTFGWGWQGSVTAENIVMLNTALEKEEYTFLFDRALELGNDTVLIMKKSVGKNERTYDDLVKEASISGYDLCDESENFYLFKRDLPKHFGVISKFEGFAIGSYVNAMTIAYPTFTAGDSYYVDDYSVEQLSQYKSIFLSGFKYHNKDEAEKILIALADQGVRIVIDSTHVPNNEGTGISEFLGVQSMAISFDRPYPMLKYANKHIITENLVTESKWNTGYLSGDFIETGYFDFEEKELVFMATNREHQNIRYIGLNIMHYMTETADEQMRELISGQLGIDDQQIPTRIIVPMDVTYSDNGMVLSSDATYVEKTCRLMGINPDSTLIDTTMSYQDIFQSDVTLTSYDQLLYVPAGEITITYQYPLLEYGLLVSGMGLIVFLLSLLWARKYAILTSS